MQNDPRLVWAPSAGREGKAAEMVIREEQRREGKAAVGSAGKGVFLFLLSGSGLSLQMRLPSLEAGGLSPSLRGLSRGWSHLPVSRLCHLPRAS